MAIHLSFVLLYIQLMVSFAYPCAYCLQFEIILQVYIFNAVM